MCLRESMAEVQPIRITTKIKGFFSRNIVRVLVVLNARSATGRSGASSINAVLPRAQKSTCRWSRHRFRCDSLSTNSRTYLQPMYKIKFDKTCQMYPFIITIVLIVFTFRGTRNTRSIWANIYHENDTRASGKVFRLIPRFPESYRSRGIRSSSIWFHVPDTTIDTSPPISRGTDETYLTFSHDQQQRGHRGI
jgi:hypothetical protein